MYKYERLVIPSGSRQIEPFLPNRVRTDKSHLVFVFSKDLVDNSRTPQKFFLFCFLPSCFLKKKEKKKKASQSPQRE